MEVVRRKKAIEENAKEVILEGSYRLDEPPYSKIIRNNLLSKIHIAKRDLAMNDEHYRILLESTFDVPTAAALTMQQLHEFLKVFKCMGWKQKPVIGNEDARYIKALQARIKSMAEELSDGHKRVTGLCKIICEVENVDWCTDEKKLLKLLAATGNILRREREVTKD